MHIEYLSSVNSDIHPTRMHTSRLYTTNKANTDNTDHGDDSKRNNNMDGDTEKSSHLSAPERPTKQGTYEKSSELQTEQSQQQRSTSSATHTSQQYDYSFWDEAYVHVRAGSGGQGGSTYQKNAKHQDVYPDGGNGGTGGNVFLIVDPSLNTLASLVTSASPFTPPQTQAMDNQSSSVGQSGMQEGSDASNDDDDGSSNDGNESSIIDTDIASASASASSPRSMSASWDSMRNIPRFRAEHGCNGERGNKSGRRGKDVCIRVPPNTQVQEIVFDEKSHTIQYRDLDTVTLDVSKLLVARGGLGGEGTAVYANSNRKSGRGSSSRRPRQSSLGGERRYLRLTLKIVADVALVGVPNAGKSTFLAAVTRARPKIANYPFTTVVPNLGVWIPPWQSSEYSARAYDSISAPTDTVIKGAGRDGLVICDVPGLIQGASYGVGLGLAFLRHVERCHVLLHLVDATSADPIGDYEMINRELVQYGSGQLADLPQVVVVNKVDVLDEDEDVDEVEKTQATGDLHASLTEDETSETQAELRTSTRLSRSELEAGLKAVMPHTRLLWMSAKEREGVDEVMTRLAVFVEKIKQVKEAETEADEEKAEEQQQQQKR
jgi:GTPase